MKVKKEDEITEKSKTEWETVKIGEGKSEKWMKEREVKEKRRWGVTDKIKVEKQYKKMSKKVKNEKERSKYRKADEE